MRTSSIPFYLTHPWVAARTVAYKFYEWTHADEPWFAQGAVRFLEKNLKSDMQVFEWGSGRSTLWLAKRAAQVVSIEYDGGWYDKVAQMIANAEVKNAQVRHLPLEHPKHDPTPRHYDPVPRYVNVIKEYPDRHFDLIIIDGHYRLTCVDQCLNKINSKGYLLIDNSNRVPLAEWEIPEDFVLVHESENVKTRTSIWQKP